MGLIYKDYLDNTNKYLLESNEKAGTGVYTFNQRLGRGTHDRIWQESQGENLAFSYVCALPLELLSATSLIAGIAVCKVLEESYSLKCGLKWANDVVVGSKKLCGILCESRPEKTSYRVVIGIGINLARTLKDFEALGLPHATSLKVLGASFDGHSLAQNLYTVVDSTMERYIKNGFTDGLAGEYTKRSVTIGRTVKVISKDAEIVATALSINKRGELVCLTGDRIITVASGDVSVRGLYGYI